MERYLAKERKNITLTRQPLKVLKLFAAVCADGVTNSAGTHTPGGGGKGKGKGSKESVFIRTAHTRFKTTFVARICLISLHQPLYDCDSTPPP